MSTVDLPLLPLGRGRDLESERGVECPGDLPSPSDPDLVARARAAKEALGERVFVLGHHYQRDEVIEFADVTGDSFKLARDAAARPEAEFIVFCGVHFMAESADILTGEHQQVVLPDLAAGCSMADMARLAQVEDAWDALEAAGVADSVVPVTYMNSSADIKAFVGRHDGTVCTSSNAETALEWAFGQKPDAKVLFLPDQHLGRNTAVLQMGFSLDECVVWNPHLPDGGLTREELAGARMILWRGHCSVHGRFSPAVVDELRATIPGVQILVHPECVHEVVLKADLVGSTEFIIKTIEAAPAGTSWAIGTELNLVKRLAAAHPDKRIAFLDKNVCYCSTMNRIDLPHFVWAMESLVAGTVANRIEVDPDTTHWARVALQRMLDLPGRSHRD
ncbi:quinolinate synthase NadA [Nocardioides euryhalodurans]|uniref:Quinolinate synthase n=1 Tax=Nocardioides euryhalodurans TaxID=2518370 RepID=A0A4P7GPK2_9ACTN|nr:quinolinate synthase NadA [Nocardioides euryhalodurans]QBR94165.1 quinolinate synthase NadA [Nocardioides euryhalodurans]